MRWLARAAAVGAAMAVGASALALSPQAGGVGGIQRTSRTFRLDPQVESRLSLPGPGGSQFGMTLRGLDAATVKQRKLPSAQGVLVDSVQPGGPADKGGIRAGDVISDYDGERVRSLRQIERLLAGTLEGLPVRIGVIRDGRALELSVLPASAGPEIDDAFVEALRRGLDGNTRALPQVPPDRQDPRELRSPDDWPSGGGRLGIVVQEITPQLAAYFGANDGVLVSSVTENSPAARAGIRAGDVVTAVGGTGVTKVDDLARALRAVPEGREVEIAMVRSRQGRTVKVKLDGARRGP